MALRRAPAAGLKKVEGESGDLFLPLEGHRRAIYAEKCPFLLSQAIHQETRCFPSLAARACGVPPPPDSSHCCTSTQLPNDAQPNDGCPGALPQPTPSSDRLSQSYKPYWNERPPRRNQAARLEGQLPTSAAQDERTPMDWEPTHQIERPPTTNYEWNVSASDTSRRD